MPKVHVRAVRAGMADGMAEGMAEGIAEGMAEGTNQAPLCHDHMLFGEA